MKKIILQIVKHIRVQVQFLNFIIIFFFLIMYREIENNFIK
jgi:hypothetical protein